MFDDKEHDKSTPVSLGIDTPQSVTWPSVGGWTRRATLRSSSMLLFVSSQGASEADNICSSVPSLLSSGTLSLQFLIQASSLVSLDGKTGLPHLSVCPCSDLRLETKKFKRLSQPNRCTQVNRAQPAGRISPAHCFPVPLKKSPQPGRLRPSPLVKRKLSKPGVILRQRVVSAISLQRAASRSPWKQTIEQGRK